jgi:hypothetical protein
LRAAWRRGILPAAAEHRPVHALEIGEMVRAAVQALAKHRSRNAVVEYSWVRITDGAIALTR